MTSARVKVLQVFLTEPQARQWGYKLMEETGLQSGTLYPILRYFEQIGWIESGAEILDSSVANRPPRQYYELSASGEPAARQAVRSFFEGFPALNLGALRNGWTT